MTRLVIFAASHLRGDHRQKGSDNESPLRLPTNAAVRGWPGHRACGGGELNRVEPCTMGEGPVTAPFRPTGVVARLQTAINPVNRVGVWAHPIARSVPEPRR